MSDSASPKLSELIPDPAAFVRWSGVRWVRRRWLGLVFGVALIACLVVVYVQLAQLGRELARQEFGGHVHSAVARAVAAFIDREGRWPHSEAELFDTPECRDLFHKIDDYRYRLFEEVKLVPDAPLEDVANATPHDLPYILGPLPVTPEWARYRHRGVIAAAKRALAKRMDGASHGREQSKSPSEAKR